MQKTVDDYIKELLELRRRAGVTTPEKESAVPQSSDKTGNLIVSVTHAQNTFPIENAAVEIFDSSENFVTRHITDSSGQTPPIPLHTVSAENSEEYASTKQVADYYTVKVSADGYVTTKIINIPIFEGITTFQPVAMTFLAASDSGDTQTIVLSNADRG